MTTTQTSLRRTLFLAYTGGAVIFLLFVAFSLNGSSLGIWSRYLTAAQPGHSHIILGEPRGIRSDEWLVNTPMMLAYVEHRKSALPTTPDYSGPVGSELLMNQPASHFSVLFRPQLWGFFLLDTDRGFSFFWGAKIFGLFLSFFTVLLLLTRSSLISAAGSTWFVLSSFMQWWFSTSLPEMVGTCLFATLGAWIVVSHPSWRLALLGWVVLLAGSINFILNLYPPFLMVTAHACLAIFFALCCKYGFVQGKALLVRTVALAGAGLSILAIMALVWLDVHAIVAVVQNTVYPGRRVSVSGGFPAFRYLTNFVDLFFSESRFPPSLGNVCEGSGFILIWPVAVLALAYLFLRKRVEKSDLIPLLPLLFVLMLHTAWMSFSIPTWFGSLFGLHLVPGVRALLGPGMLNVVLFTAVASLSAKRFYPPKYLDLSPVAVLILASIIGFSIQKAVPPFFTFQEISLVSLAVACASIGLFVGRPLLIWLPILFLVAPNVLINPVVRGTAPLTNNRLLQVAKNVRAKDPDARWAVYGDGIHGNLVKVSGARVFNGVSYAPRMEDYRILDPEGKYMPIYNRYAHITLESAPLGAPRSFELIQGDAIIAKIHPCDPVLPQIGIRYFLFSYKPQPHEVTCLQKVKPWHVGRQFFLYKSMTPKDLPHHNKKASSATSVP